MSAALAAPIGALALGHTNMVPVLAALAALVLYQHRENIARLRAGTEPKVGAKKG
jgi:glycerol-3-phosphate acyltransferase PlsY